MTSQEFIDNLQLYHEGEYSDPEIEEIHRLIYDFSGEQKQKLSDNIQDK